MDDIIRTTRTAKPTPAALAGIQKSKNYYDLLDKISKRFYVQISDSTDMTLANCVRIILNKLAYIHCTVHFKTLLVPPQKFKTFLKLDFNFKICMYAYSVVCRLENLPLHYSVTIFHDRIAFEFQFKRNTIKSYEYKTMNEIKHTKEICQTTDHNNESGHTINKYYITHSLEVKDFNNHNCDLIVIYKK
ncbi:hypothetical protein AGLY_008313 [Aphis glycines]|uniref:Uncharacterized protein n=1 Tax=Aphis glycines TaxID=307491 RepID=A0A6G0TLX9_APHGL|nr:hypothetical protein AGLY_008313 [Aphis glycines]